MANKHRWQNKPRNLN